jgi:hypothetical protein
MTITLQALSLVENTEPVQARFTLRLRDQQSMWMQDGCKVYMHSYMASNGSCFMFTRIIFKNHLLEIGLTQNRETMTLRMLTTIDLFLPCTRTNMNRNSLKEHLVEGSVTYDFTLHFWGSVTTLHDFGGVVGWPLDTFFWALTISWSRLLKWVWSGLKLVLVWLGCWLDRVCNLPIGGCHVATTHHVDTIHLSFPTFVGLMPETELRNWGAQTPRFHLRWYIQLIYKSSL